VAAYFYQHAPKRRFVRLRALTVLAWFQGAWARGDRADAELRGRPYGLDALWDAIEEHALAAPATDAELAAALEAHVYTENSIEVEPHLVHVETDDDEDAVEYFFFDDDYLASDDPLQVLRDLV
jgi:hypothetical protein